MSAQLQRSRTPDEALASRLRERGISRRSFLKFCGVMAGVMALPPRYAHTIARELTQAQRLPLVWLNGQDCAGNTEGFLRAAKPTVAEVILDTLSVDYQEVLMVPAGAAAEKSLHDTIAAFPNGYVAIVEGSIPLADGGVYCMIGGRAFAEIVRQVCGAALATITAGTCAWDGGLPAAQGGRTGAVGVATLVPQARIINLPGCPMNVENLTATLVHYLTFKDWPATDRSGRPLFAYGDTVHQRCESLPHFRAGRFVREWGDEGHQKGWCLYQMGCKGPNTSANCPTVKFNGGTSWPVSAGHGCVGCTESQFWDRMSSFYRRGGPQDVPSPTPARHETPAARPSATGTPASLSTPKAATPTPSRLPLPATPTVPPAASAGPTPPAAPGSTPDPTALLGGGAIVAAGAALAYGLARLRMRQPDAEPGDRGQTDRAASEGAEPDSDPGERR